MGIPKIQKRLPWVLPDEERHDPASLVYFSVALLGGGSLPLSSAVVIEPRNGFDVPRHFNGRSAVRVTSDVDPGTWTRA